MYRQPKPVAEFIDAYEQARVIHRSQNGTLHVKREKSGAVWDLSAAIAKYVGQNIRERRLAKKMTMATLAYRAGMSASKMRIREIEIGSSGGIKLGTLYAIALSLGCSPFEFLPDASVVLKESGVSMVGDMRLYTRSEIERMVRAVNGPEKVK